MIAIRSFPKKRLVALAAVLALVGGCSTMNAGYFQILVQGGLDKIWNTPSIKAAAESKAEASLHNQLQKFAGTVVETPWYVPDDILVLGFSNENVSIGAYSPKIEITKFKYTELSQNYLIELSWKLQADDPASWGEWWNRPTVTGHVHLAGEDFGDWFIPDLDAFGQLRSGVAAGTAVFLVSKDLTKGGTVTVKLSSASLDLSAVASGEIIGFDFSVDVTSYVKPMANEYLARRAVGKAISIQINASNVSNWF